jgi:hypothetical protein
MVDERGFGIRQERLDLSLKLVRPNPIVIPIANGHKLALGVSAQFLNGALRKKGVLRLDEKPNQPPIPRLVSCQNILGAVCRSVVPHKNLKRKAGFLIQKSDPRIFFDRLVFLFRTQNSHDRIVGISWPMLHNLGLGRHGQKR